MRAHPLLDAAPAGSMAGPDRRGRCPPPRRRRRQAHGQSRGSRGARLDRRALPRTPYLKGGARLLLPALLAVALPASPARAQIVNVQNLAGKAVSEGLSGNVGLDFNLRAGNVQFLLTSAGLTTFYKFDDNVLLLSAKAAYGLKGAAGEWNEEPFRERVFEHLRYRRQLTERVAVEAFGQHEYDRWRRLRIRTLAGAGPRFDIPLGKTSHGAVGIAYMWQGEELLEPREGDPTGFYVEHRVSMYTTGSAKLTDNTVISGTLYAQPRLDDPADIRGLLDGTLTVALTRKLGLKVVYVVALDSRPPRTVRGYDVTAKVGFAYAL